jgi:hypothetical protein
VKIKINRRPTSEADGEAFPVIPIVKVIRDLTGLNLSASKALMEALRDSGHVNLDVIHEENLRNLDAFCCHIEVERHTSVTQAAAKRLISLAVEQEEFELAKAAIDLYVKFYR